MSDEAVGLIVDYCSSLRVLKLFGCTQVYPFLDSSPGKGSKFFDYDQFSNHSRMTVLKFSRHHIVGF